MLHEQMTRHKLVVLGDGGVGKTALTIQLIFNHFPETYDPTIEDSYRKQVVIDQQSCMLEVLDTAGQREYVALRDQWIQGNEGFMLVYSISSRASFARIEELHHQIQRVKEFARAEVPPHPSSPLLRTTKTPYLPAPIILVGNKSDRVAERQVSTQEGSALAKQLDCEFVEASAKSCDSTQRAFFKVVRQLRKQQAFALQPPRFQDHDSSLGKSQLASKNPHHDDNRKGERCRKHGRYSWFTKSRLFGNIRQSESSHTRTPSLSKVLDNRAPSASMEPHTRAPSPSKEPHDRAPSASMEPHNRAPSASMEPHNRAPSPSDTSSTVSSSIYRRELLPLKAIPNRIADVSTTKDSSAEDMESEAGDVSQSGLVDEEADDPQHSSLINRESYKAQLVLMGKMAQTLFCTKELEPVLTTALRDPDICVMHMQDKVVRMIRSFGRDLKSEAREKIPHDIAQALGTSSVLFHAARSLIQHLQKSSAEPSKAGQRTHSGKDADTDSHGSSTNILSEDVEKLSTTDLRDTHHLLFNSDAYQKFKMDLLEFTHKPYGKRVFCTLGINMVGPDGEYLNSDAVHNIAEEISWVPIRLLEFSHDNGSSRSDSFKASVENFMGETWNWWPLAPRLHSLRSGYFRLRWKSPCGTTRHVDLPAGVKEALEQTIDTAPAFINIDLPSKSLALPPRGCGNTGQSPGNNTSSPSRSGSGGMTSATTFFKPPLRSQQTSKPAPNATLASSSVTQSVQAHRLEQHLSLCVIASSRHFISLRCDDLRSDLEFFAMMKAAYNRARGWPRLWFSMWQYKHSEFVLFHKYGYRRGARVDIGFPDDNDQMYQFLPRKPSPPPPNGPISKEQFYDHYYLDQCPSLYDWRRYQLSYRGHFNKVSRVALDAVPKRLIQINMDDGVNEHFFGLYAKEERSAAHVAVYASLCNIPWIVFGFLWLFLWGHDSDLQNASVPLTLSLTLTLGFTAVVFGTRDSM